MATRNVYIPDKLQERMSQLENVSWSAVAVRAFEAELNEIAKQEEQRVKDSVLDRQEIKENLVMDIEGTAHWRECKAKEYPEDERNAECAKALRDAAAAINALPLSHSLFSKLGEIYASNVFENYGETWIEWQSALWARFGFDCPGDPVALLEELEEKIDEWLGEHS